MSTSTESHDASHDRQTGGTSAAAPTAATKDSRRSPGRAWTVWLARRFGLSILTLWLVSVIVFAATSALGDPVRAVLGRDYEASPERAAAIRETLHLDQSLPERYLLWIGDLLRGNPGQSVAAGVPVTELMGGRVLNSLFLVAVVALVMIPVALGLALLCARFRGSRFDDAVQVVALGFAGVPEFVIGILLVALFSTTVLHVLPAVTALPIGAKPWHAPASMILPVATLVISIVPYLTRMLRSSLVETLDSDYVELARLKGVPETATLLRHALPNTLVPTIQVTALQLGWLVGGVVLIEYLFNYPGIGAMLVEAVRNSDFPVVLALTMIIAAAYVLVNLIADILSILATPRARTGMVR